jgi:hypothetical protein
LECDEKIQVIIKKFVNKECAQGILGENIKNFRGKYTFFGLGKTAFILYSAVKYSEKITVCSYLIEFQCNFHGNLLYYAMFISQFFNVTFIS